jgi:hypothetical protein
MRNAAYQREPGSGSPYRTPPPPHVGWRSATRDPDERWPPRLQLLALAAVAIAAWLVTIGWREHRLNTDIEKVPAAERQILYSRTMDELRTTCRVTSALSDHCRDQAELVLRLPECDVQCRALAALFFEHARR